jgi:NADPH:quinone reductase-like Zn-dependent oxidoreductase
MKAIVTHTYGPPDVLMFEDVESPTIGDDDVLVRVHAASVNPLDWHYTTGTPYLLRLSAGLRRPKRSIRGVDLAGRVDSVGANVTEFRPGDAVFGSSGGSFAEYVSVTEKDLVHLPSAMSFEDAAAVPIAAITALQGLRDHARVRAGQSVLINGAAGGVGTYAVQIAKALGADVTGVCSTKNVEMVRSLGADHVIDYTADDFASHDHRYDVMLDNVGNRSLSDCRRVLTAKGTYVVVGGPKKGKWLGPVKRLVAAKVRFMFASQRSVSFVAKMLKKDLLALVELIESGQIRSVIDRRYPLANAADAVHYLADGHASGKVIIDVVDQPSAA